MATEQLKLAFTYKYFLFKPRLHSWQSGPMEVQSKWTLDEAVFVVSSGIFLCEQNGEPVQVQWTKVFKGKEKASSGKGEIYLPSWAMRTMFSFDVEGGSKRHQQCMKLFTTLMRNSDDSISLQLALLKMPPEFPSYEDAKTTLQKGLLKKWEQMEGSFESRIQKTLFV